jgi:ketosteroid isomerase-like protein
VRIDPTLTWRKVEQRLMHETDPRRRRNLETVLAHMKAEMRGDLDGLMATVAEDARYHAYATPDPAFSPKGKAAVRDFYAAYVASGAHRLQFDIDRLVVDTECVITEGVMRIAYPGSLLKMLGHAIDDPDAFYLYETRMCTLWPMDANGLVIGEDTYVGGGGFEGIAGRKLRPEDLPPDPPAA